MTDKSGDSFFRRRYPAVGLVVFFALGIILGHQIFQISSGVILLSIFVSSIIFVPISIFRLRKTSELPDLLLTAFAWTTLLLYGILLSPTTQKQDTSFPALVYEVEGVISSSMVREDSSIIFLESTRIGSVDVGDVKVVLEGVDTDWFFPGVAVKFIGSVIATNPGVFFEYKEGFCITSCDVKARYLPGLLREYIRRGIREVTDPKAAGLISAVTLGVRDELSSDWYGAFTRSGNGHLLAVSGLHTGVICFLAYFLVSFMAFSPRIRWLAALISCLLFMAVVGLNPPVVRATVMVLATFSAAALGRRKNSINSLFFAVFAIVLVDPTSLFSPSLHLSAFAILGILLLGLPLSERIRRSNILDTKIKVFSLFLLRYTCISLSAWAFSTPLIAYYFGSVNPYAFLFAIITIPLLALLVIASVILIVTYLLSGGSLVLAAPAVLFAHILAIVNIVLDKIPGSQMEISSPTCVCVILAFALLITGGILLRTRAPVLAIVCFVLLIPLGFMPAEKSVGCFELGEGNSRIVAVSNGNESMVFCSGMRSYRSLKGLLASNQLPPAQAVVRLSVLDKPFPADVKDREYYPIHSKTQSKNIYFKGAEITLDDISAKCISPPNYNRSRFGSYLFKAIWRVKLRDEVFLISR